MKKIPLTACMIAAVLVFSYCNPSKKATAPVAPAITYNADISTLVEAKCTPCHIPAKGGKKESLDTYTAVKENIVEIIRRIELNPAERGFMPFKHPKLSDAEINTFKAWKESGMAETK